MTPRHCATCSEPVSLLRQVRLQRHTYCGHTCAAAGRDAEAKARHDAGDGSPTVCRCEGPPQPLEPAGPHCSECRRMFSAGVRLWLIRRDRRRRFIGMTGLARWVEELAAQLRLQRLPN